MSKIKVIFLGRYNSYHRNQPMYAPRSDSFFLYGIGQFIASEFYSRGYPVFFEIWRTDLRIQSTLEKEIRGIKCRIFPSKRRFKIGEYSSELISALKSESGKKDVVFHFIPNHQLNFHFYSFFIRKNKIISSHIGGANPYWLYQNSVGLKKWTSLFYYLVEKVLIIRNYDCFTSICIPEVDYYQKINGRISHMPVFGIPRESIFYIKNRIEARKKLGLPIHKKILLQVGRAVQERGFDWILEVTEHYKEQDDYYFVFAGVNPEDPYYEQLKEEDFYIIPYVDHETLPDFYNAADMLFYLPHNKLDLNFAGTSYVPIEALACGTPVIATTLHHFPGEEITEVSRLPKKKEDVIPMIEELINLKISRERCRKIALQYFSWNTIIQKYWELYNR